MHLERRNMPGKPTVIVLGAGCVGLTTAIEILKQGHAVLVVAEHLPGDPLNAEYASTAAGAHHLSFAGNDDWRQRFLDVRTYDKFWEQTVDKDAGEAIGLMRLTQTEFYKGDTHLRILEQLPGFKLNDRSTLPPGIEHSVSFTSLTIEPARYLPYLSSELLRLGGKLQRIPRLANLADAARYAQEVVAVVNCTGLGAVRLGGVKDSTVHPVRGQVLAVDAPWVKSGWTRQIGSLAGGEGGERTYVIPRASGEVIIGGTRETDDWETRARPETSEDIIRRALEICPQLALPPWSPYTPIDLATRVKAAVVGFRPTRDKGIRLEPEQIATSRGKLLVIHNYGHGGYGWQSAWGCAEEAARMLGEELREQGGVLFKAKL